MDMNFVENEVGCMAYAIYAEAHTQSREAQQGVGYLIMNRLNSHKFGDSICEIVYSKGQFQGISDIKKHKHANPNNEDFLKSELIAVDVYFHRVMNPIGSSLYFHDDSIKSMSRKWGKKQVKIDNLIFY